MTREEARQFGLNLLHGIVERNKVSDPCYADNVKQAIDDVEIIEEEKPKDTTDWDAFRREAALNLVDAVERYMRQECLRSKLAMKKDKLKAMLP